MMWCHPPRLHQICPWRFDPWRFWGGDFKLEVDWEKLCSFVCLYTIYIYTVHAVISYMLVTRMLTGVRKESSQFHWSNRGICQPWSQDSLENPSYPQWKTRIVSTNLQQTRSHKQYIIQQRAVFRLVKRSAKRCRLKMLMMLKFL